MSITERMQRKSTVSDALTIPTARKIPMEPRAIFTRGSLLWNPRLQRLRQRFPDRRQLDPVEDVLEEAADDQPLGVLTGQAAGHGVEELVAVDLGKRRAVRAAHVVGEDLEAGNRVRVRVFGQQQVAVLLVRVRLLGVL